MDNIKKILTKLKKENETNFSQGSFYGIVNVINSILNKIDSSSPYYKDTIDDVKRFLNTSMTTDSKRDRIGSLIDMALTELELSNITVNQSKIPQNEKITKMGLQVSKDNKKVFIVHGHNELMKQNVARIIEKIGLNPIILHEQPNFGYAIIEKFIANSDVGYAIVLLSADDIGYSKKEGSANAKERTRQNVIFELGFFTALLGRDRVVAIVENSKNFEIPSDIHGVIYIPFDGPDGRYKFELIKEIKAVGYDLDLTKLFEDTHN